MQIITKPSNYFAIHTQAEINAAHNECKEVRESLYDALMRGDESIAVARMKMHIQDIEDRIFESKASSHSIDIVV